MTGGMNAVVLSIGDELLLGQVVNTNAGSIAQRLSGAGVDIREILTVGDDRVEILRGLEEACALAGFVVVTGGLGPTHDDVTKNALAEFFALPLVSDPRLRERIGTLLATRNLAWGPDAEEQAMIPSGAAVLPNRYGTAPGMMIEKAGTTVIALPGVPHEMEQILTDSVLPIVAERIQRNGGMVVLHRTLRTTGISESALSALIGGPESLPPKVKIAFLPSLSGVRLRLDAAGESAEAARTLDRAEEMIREKAGRHLYATGDVELEAVVGELLVASKLTIACAESCTGGSIARKITSVAGSSRYFLGAVVAYDNRLKETLLSVTASTIASHGAVSRETALAMAAGIRQQTGADVAISTTGIAGPTGGTPDKPVGLVWIGYEDAGGSLAVRQTYGEGRSRVVERATFSALELVRRKLLRLV